MINNMYLVMKEITLHFEFKYSTIWLRIKIKLRTGEMSHVSQRLIVNLLFILNDSRMVEAICGNFQILILIECVV